MRYPNQRFILITLFLLGIIAIFLTFLGGFGLGESGYNFLGKTKKVTLAPGEPVMQTFTAHENNLYQIRVVMGKTDLQGKDTLEFRLLDETCQNELALTTYTDKPNKQGAYTIFSFPAIQNSKGKQFCFVVMYSSEENRKSEKPYLSATDAPDSVFADRTLTDTNKNKVYPSQTLFLRPAYTGGSLTDDLWNLVNRLSQYKPEFLKDWSIVVLFTILIVGSIDLAYQLVYTREKE